MCVCVCVGGGGGGGGGFARFADIMKNTDGIILTSYFKQTETQKCHIPSVR